MEFTVKYKVGTDRYRYYYQVLVLLSHMPTLVGLRTQSLQVLAHLLRHRDRITGSGLKDPVMVGEALFSYPTKVEIAERMGVTDGAIRTSLVQLRKKGLVKGKTLALPMEIKYLEPVVFRFAEA